jgi:hypothetical protein
LKKNLIILFSTLFVSFGFSQQANRYVGIEVQNFFNFSRKIKEEKLTIFFDSWIENYDQIDDHCVLAI